MTKNFTDIPHKSYARVAHLLQKLQSRLGRQAYITARLNEHVQIQEAAIARLEREANNKEPVYPFTRLDALEAGTKEFTDSLYKFRESVQKSFDKVSEDVRQVLKALQHANARASELESQNLALISRIEILEGRASGQDTRLKVSEDTLRLLRELLLKLQELK